MAGICVVYACNIKLRMRHESCAYIYIYTVSCQRNITALEQEADVLQTMESPQRDSYGAPIYKEAVIGGMEMDKVHTNYINIRRAIG